ncbi:putative cupin domain protein [Botrytis fragariae]|uniref:Putative cupin domain protein n=1 Tax=Botrytis fragariae TaxID=1964551 RepID=A0A8H6ALI0_9HELO|nr:putative cupin domain protein [Botrytis fragariae]KAF5869569.1 putative cupin domain protein [Botrytis fragariae]
MSSQTPKFDNKCYITTNSPDGKTTTFVDSTSFVTKSTYPGLTLRYAYSATSTPSLTDETDLKAHQEMTKQEKIVSFPSAGGSAAAFLHFDPNPDGTEGFMHRTRTLDYVYVVEGEAEYTVNSGEKKIFKKGDVVIQRAGWHAWKNVSKKEGATLFAVTVGAEGATEGFMELPNA